MSARNLHGTYTEPTRNMHGTYTEPTRNLHGTCMGSTRPLTPQQRTMHRTRGPPEAQTPDPRTLSPHPAPPSLDQRKVYTLAGRRSRCAMCLRTGTRRPPARHATLVRPCANRC